MDGGLEVWVKIQRIKWRPGVEISYKYKKIFTSKKRKDSCKNTEEYLKKQRDEVKKEVEMANKGMKRCSILYASEKYKLKQ